jgi:hypothetical protein
MRLRKTLSIVACASLLSAAALVSPRHAYAQDADSADPEAGAWSADEVGPQDATSEPNTTKPPLDVQGCWSGKVHDRAKGTGTISLALQQNEKLLEPGISSFQVFWNIHNFAEGPITKGSVGSNRIIFKGSATTKSLTCTISASATGNAKKLRGTYSFHELCGHFFKGGTFSVTPGPC